MAVKMAEEYGQDVVVLFAEAQGLEQPQAEDYLSRFPSFWG